MKLRFDSCPNCFAMLHGKTICENCDTDIHQIKEYSQALLPFTLMNNKYLLGRVLGKGGFGITYVAQNIETGKLCCIKEFMPAEYAVRNNNGTWLEPREKENTSVYEHGKERFIDEARTLVKLNHNDIVVDILDFYEENNTAYFVMEYLNGVSMKQLTATYGGKLPKEIADRILEVIGTALMDVHHKGMLHRDISPENIFITKSGKIKLIDFGAARDYIMSQNVGMSVVLKTGYAPPEQYSSKGAQGPWTDIYALAATYYTCVSGEKLLDSMYILKGMKQAQLDELNCGVSKPLSDVIAKAMAINYRERYADVETFLKDLKMNHSTETNLVNGQIENSEQILEKISSNHNTANTRFSKSKYQQISGNGFDYDRSINGPRVTPVETLPLNLGRAVVKAFINGKESRRINLPDNQSIAIGRSNKSCNLVINSSTAISRVHILLAYQRNINKFVVTDKSANGTYLSDGTRLNRDEETYLDAGSVIFLADKNSAVQVNLE